MGSWLSRLFNAHDHTVDMLHVAIAAYVILAGCCVLVFLSLSCYTVMVLHNEFHFGDFGQGIGLVFGGTGLAALLHSWKSPGAPPPSEGN
jgi:hypothetical protein